MEIKTERLLLRQWREEDLKPFAQLNADPRVREYFPKLLSREESDASAKMMSELIEKKGGASGLFHWQKQMNSLGCLD